MYGRGVSHVILANVAREISATTKANVIRSRLYCVASGAA